MNFKELETTQKLRGAYYTHPDIAEFLTRWVLASNPSDILEPSCGDGVFLEMAARLAGKRKLRLVGCEIDPEEADKAKKRTTQVASKHCKIEIKTGDFLEWSLSRLTARPEFDAVIGNPPFIRYQYLEKEQQDRAQFMFDYFGLPFTKHTNAWVPFILASISQLRPGGRLAMVVPAELLHVLHATSLRHFLLRHCSKIVILDPAEIWFTETLQGVVLLLAEKAHKADDMAGELAIVPVKNRTMLNDDAVEVFDKAITNPGSTFNGKWMVGLLPKDERMLLERLETHPGVSRFKEIASVDVGIVTGANKFFLVSDEVVSDYELQEWAHPMFGRSGHVRGVIYDTSTHEENRRMGLPTNFLWFNPAQHKKLPKRAREYIETGEAQDLHLRYKCRIRSPWYTVPSVYTTPVGLMKRSHNFPRLILNKARAYTTDTAYRIKVQKTRPSDLVVSFVNSLTALSAELEGRHYGGGVLELVPSEIEKVLVPLGRFENDAIRRLEKMTTNATSADEILASQDKVVLGKLGISKTMRDELAEAWTRLKKRRQRTPSKSK